MQRIESLGGFEGRSLLAQSQALAPCQRVFQRRKSLTVAAGSPGMHGIGQTCDAFGRLALLRRADGVGLGIGDVVGPAEFGFNLGIGEVQGGIVGTMGLITHDLATVQFDNALAHRVDDLFVMCGHHDGGAGTVDSVQHLHNAQRCGRVKVAGGLVGQQDLRVVHIRTGDGHALLLATGQLMRIVLLFAGKTHGVQHLGHQRLNGGTAGTDHLERERHVLPHGFVVEQLVVLEHEAQRTAVMRHLTVGDTAQVVAGHTNLTAGGLLLAQQQAQQRGFTGSGCAHQEHEVATLYAEVDAIKRGPSALRVNLGHIVQCNQSHDYSSFSAARRCS